jgi:zinc protease
MKNRVEKLIITNDQRKTKGSVSRVTKNNQPSFGRFLTAALSLVLASIVAVNTSLLTAPGAHAQTPATTTGQTGGQTQTAAVQRIEATQAALVTEFEVNGLKVLVKKREGSQTVAAGLFLRGGSRNITAENAGIEALMLSAASEASANFPRERMRRETSRMGTGIGTGVNYDYSALTLAATRQNFDRSWEIFTDVALRPTFAREDVQLIQSRLVASLRNDTDDPDTYLQRLQEQVAYSGHPYINRPQGTAESIARLTPEDLRRHHQQMMQTSRLLLVIVGDLDAAQLRERINASFGKLPRGDYKQQPVPQLSFTNSTVDVTARVIPTNYVQGVFAAPPLVSDDIYPMRVAMFILGQRVLEEVRFKRNLSYLPDAFLGNQGANVGGIYVTAVDANQAVRVMLGEITRLQFEALDPSEITATIGGFLTNYYLRQETNAAQVGELAMFELLGGGWRNSIDFLERLRAVTPADVQRVSQKYMRNIRFVVLGDPARVDKKIFTFQLSE